MTDTLRLHRLGDFLRGVAALIFAGTIVELLVTGHYREPAQLIPFVLCGAGLAALLGDWRWPGQLTTRILQAVMTVVAAGSVIGAYFHLQSNLASVVERQPDLSGLSLLLATIGGRNPFGAPGILAVGAIVALAASYAVFTPNRPVPVPAARPLTTAPSLRSR